MKDSLFEMLINLFEKSLAQLKKTQAKAENEEGLSEETVDDSELLCVKLMNPMSFRILTLDERIKLTKASYQFLMRIKRWGVLQPELLEKVLHQLMESDSNLVSLEETKWTIRQVMAPYLEKDQLAFLDLVLYRHEDKVTIN